MVGCIYPALARPLLVRCNHRDTKVSSFQIITAMHGAMSGRGARLHHPKPFLEFALWITQHVPIYSPVARLVLLTLSVHLRILCDLKFFPRRMYAS